MLIDLLDEIYQNIFSKPESLSCYLYNIEVLISTTTVGIGYYNGIPYFIAYIRSADYIRYTIAEINK